jgi:hypothetical protein
MSVHADKAPPDSYCNAKLKQINFQHTEATVNNKHPPGEVYVDLVLSPKRPCPHGLDPAHSRCLRTI